MRYDFHELKTVTAYDAITLRVPKRWDVEEDAGDQWGCYEANADTGTLWIALHRYEDSPDTDRILGVNFRGYAEDIAAEVRQQHNLVIDDPIEAVKDGYCWTHAMDGEEGGEMLRYFRFDLQLKRGRQRCFINFSLVLTVAQVADPEFQQLLEIMEREIRNARLEVFRDSERPATTEDAPFGPSSPVDFDGKAELTLPDAVQWAAFQSATNPDEVRYIGLLDREESRAVIHVTVDVSGVAPRNGDAEAGSQARIDEWIESRRTRGAIERLSDGAIDYCEYAETADGARDEKPGYRHEWTYFQCADGKARALSVILALPDPMKDSPPFTGLASVLDRAVRAAAFPVPAKD